DLAAERNRRMLLHRNHVAHREGVRVQFSGETALTDAIMAILKNFRRPLAKSELRSLVVDHGIPVEKLGETATFFYTSLKRLRDRQLITEDSEGNVLLTPQP